MRLLRSFLFETMGSKRAAETFLTESPQSNLNGCVSYTVYVRPPHFYRCFKNDIEFIFHNAAILQKSTFNSWLLTNIGVTYKSVFTIYRLEDWYTFYLNTCCAGSLCRFNLWLHSKEESKEEKRTKCENVQVEGSTTGLSGIYWRFVNQSRRYCNHYTKYYSVMPTVSICSVYKRWLIVFFTIEINNMLNILEAKLTFPNMKIRYSIFYSCCTLLILSIINLLKCTSQ